MLITQVFPAISTHLEVRGFAEDCIKDSEITFQINPIKPGITIFIFIHYMLRIAFAIIDL